MDQMVEQSLKVPATIWKQAFAGLFEDDYSDELDRLAVPTLVLWGTAGSMVPAPDADIPPTALAALPGSCVGRRGPRSPLGGRGRLREAR
ncbi:alpha/beta fold hydrolase [Caenimonas soli]|uniref:alpha/beta fold hydrolase n=1 Tax=Caenimonas soli TaxID=2735555 RepID=UPI001555867D|nr:hypothetical protein [Caenimonas soli]NPC55610.1 hypothetical protein [Caenimonas soli]